jgi:hypothetical protein
MPRSRRSPGPLATVVFLILLAWPAAAPAQGTGGPSVRDSSVGYIDNAIPGDEFRLRLDAGWNDRRPTLAEFFWAKGKPFGPGVPRPESRVDFQDLSGYLEAAVTERFSAFVEVPWRFLNPEVNANTNGVGDMNFGFKWAFLYSDDGVATFQFRTYVPTGDAGRGLGNNHVSLEPALLLYQPLTDRLGLEGEFRSWVPVGGTDFAGDVLRYGVGLTYDLGETTGLKFVPVVELVGWTVLDGKQSILHPSGEVSVEGAAGDTILDVKVGMHVKLGCWGDFYTGYGRPLTGNRWYENIYRVELRLFF